MEAEILAKECFLDIDSLRNDRNLREFQLKNRSYGNQNDWLETYLELRSIFVLKSNFSCVELEGEFNSG